jgi:hypothetical protein
MGNVTNINCSKVSALRTALIDSGLEPINAAAWVQPQESSRALDEVCSSLRLTSVATMVWVEAPHLRTAACRLIDYVTLRFPGSDGALVPEVIKDAVDAYGEAGFRPNSARGEVLFVNRLSHCADHVLARQAVAIDPRDGNLRSWDAWRQSLPAWLGNGRYSEFFLRRREKRSEIEVLGARTALAAQLVGHRELGMLEMFKLNESGRRR